MSRNFIILSAGRCGTGVVKESLNKIDGVYCADEVFKPASLRSEAQMYEDVHGSVFTRQESVRGCKLFFKHIPSDTDTRWEWYRDNATVLHIHREDLLRWYVSLASCMKTKVWHVADASGVPPVRERRITIDTEHMARAITDYRHKKAWARKFFTGDYAEFACEELSQSWQKTFARIQLALGLKDVAAVPPPFVRMNTEETKRLVENYDEVLSAFSNLAN